ncbi:MAG: 3-methyl-2-oxobutanoate hydroxymethyltransferase, partial [Nitrospinota bacterium]
MERCKVTVDKVLKRKGGAKICALTAYTYSMARLADRAGVDILLVGDSLAMVELGLPNTLGVGMEEMLHHTRAVARAEPKALLAVDMPFMSYGVSREETVRNAGRLIKEGGAEAVKLEGGRRVRDEIASLVDREIPVMGHVGLTPQSIHRMGGYKVQGKGEKGA